MQQATYTGRRNPVGTLRTAMATVAALSLNWSRKAVASGGRKYYIILISAVEVILTRA